MTGTAAHTRRPHKQSYSVTDNACCSQRTIHTGVLRHTRRGGLHTQRATRVTTDGSNACMSVLDLQDYKSVCPHCGVQLSWQVAWSHVHIDCSLHRRGNSYCACTVSHTRCDIVTLPRCIRVTHMPAVTGPRHMRQRSVVWSAVGIDTPCPVSRMFWRASQGRCGGLTSMVSMCVTHMYNADTRQSKTAVPAAH